MRIDTEWILQVFCSTQDEELTFLKYCVANKLDVSFGKADRHYNVSFSSEPDYNKHKLGINKT